MSRFLWQREDWPAFRWSDAELAPLLQRVQLKRAYLNGWIAGLEGDHAARVIAELATEETLATAAIEGVHFSAAQVRSSIMRRLGLGYDGDQTDRISPAARGVIDVLADSTENAGRLSLDRLFAWHAALFPSPRVGLSVVLVGALRGAGPMQIVSGPVGRERVHFEAPPCDRLPEEMSRFIDWANGVIAAPLAAGQSKALAEDVTLRACLAHLWFETLHPFEDGNGRIGRAVSDLLLSQAAGYHAPHSGRLWAASPVFLRQRRDYYAALESAQRGDGDITAWLSWAAQCIESAYDEARRCIERVGQVAQFWVQHRDFDFNPRQRRALEIALAGNDLSDGWLTVRRWVKLTGVAAVTASRDLAQLEDAGILRRDPTMGGRSTRYAIVLAQAPSRRLVRDYVW